MFRVLLKKSASFQKNDFCSGGHWRVVARLARRQPQQQAMTSLRWFGGASSAGDDENQQDAPALPAVTPGGTATTGRESRNGGSLDVPSSTPLSYYLASASIDEAAAETATTSSSLLTHFLEKVIDYGVPASIVLMALVAKLAIFDKYWFKEWKNYDDNPVAELYDDLYGDQKSKRERDRERDPSPLLWPFESRRTKALPKNAGVPAKQYLIVTHLNLQHESYAYTMQASTQSKASAAARYRQRALARALGKSLLSNGDQTEPPPAALDAASWQALEKAEHDFLEKGRKLVAQLHEGHAQMAQTVVDEELQELGLKKDKLQGDLYANVKDEKSSWSAFFDRHITQLSKSSSLLPEQEMEKASKQLRELELQFLRDVVKAAGSQHGPALRAALLGNAATQLPGGLLTALEERPLKALLTTRSSNSANEETAIVATAPAPRVFVIKFSPMSEMGAFRKKVTAIVRHAQPGVDHVVLELLSPGGTVTEYGLAAGQLQRFKDAGLFLTVAVEEVAASGGYMMCCVADRIVASPFAALGSIGVLTQMPILHKRLEREGVEFATVTAGKYKRTLSPFKELTDADVEKTQQEVEAIQTMFQTHILKHRPQLDMEQVATGEVWFGTDALERQLCDEIKTSDDVLLEYMDQGYDVYSISYREPIDSDFITLFPWLANAPFRRLLRQGVQWLSAAAAAHPEGLMGSGIPHNAQNARISSFSAKV